LTGFGGFGESTEFAGLGFNSQNPPNSPHPPNLTTVLDKNRFAHIDGQFADVFDVIADPFQIFGDKEQSREPRRFRVILRHRLHHFGKQPLVNLVDFFILAD
jgi:hypothetical protein